MVVLGSTTSFLLINKVILSSSKFTYLVILAIVLGIIIILPKQFRIPITVTAGFFSFGIQIPLWTNITALISLEILVVLLIILVAIQLREDILTNTTKYHELKEKVDMGSSNMTKMEEDTLLNPTIYDIEAEGVLK